MRFVPVGGFRRRLFFRRFFREKRFICRTIRAGFGFWFRRFKFRGGRIGLKRPVGRRRRRGFLDRGILPEQYHLRRRRDKRRRLNRRPGGRLGRNRGRKNIRFRRRLLRPLCPPGRQGRLGRRERRRLRRRQNRFRGNQGFKRRDAASHFQPGKKVVIIGEFFFNLIFGKRFAAFDKQRFRFNVYSGQAG
jgi:hypothetical protein